MANGAIMRVVANGSLRVGEWVVGRRPMNGDDGIMANGSLRVGECAIMTNGANVALTNFLAIARLSLVLDRKT